METIMNKKTYVPKSPRTETDFSKKWGILAYELAQEEGTTCDAIHMRVRNYGNPFQRKRSPTLCEIMTGKTAIELAHELGVTPITIWERLKNYGDAYFEHDSPTARANRGKTKCGVHWSETRYGGIYTGAKQGWLSPRHPEYKTWRFKYIKQYCPISNEHTNTKEATNDTGE